MANMDGRLLGGVAPAQLFAAGTAADRLRADGTMSTFGLPGVAGVDQPRADALVTCQTGVELARGKEVLMRDLEASTNEALQSLMAEVCGSQEPAPRLRLFYCRAASDPEYRMADQSASTAELPQTGFVRERQLLPHVPFSHSTLWRLVKDKRFPAPVRVAENITAWRCADVHAWLQSLDEVAA